MITYTGLPAALNCELFKFITLYRYSNFVRFDETLIRKYRITYWRVGILTYSDLLIPSQIGNIVFAWFNIGHRMNAEVRVSSETRGAARCLSENI